MDKHEEQVAKMVEYYLGRWRSGDSTQYLEIDANGQEVWTSFDDVDIDRVLREDYPGDASPLARDEAVRRLRDARRIGEIPSPPWGS